MFRSPSGFIGEPQKAREIPEDPADYFEVIPVDSEGCVIEGIRGLMHPDVLAYMRAVGPRPEGDYLFYADSGRLRYTLSEETDGHKTLRGTEGKSMKTIEIFDPALCCSTGVCGPGVDPELLRVATVVASLQERGAVISRHNLASEPQDFVSNKTMAALLEKEGAEILPVTLVDGDVAKTGVYPSNEEFELWTGLPAAGSAKAGGACCCCSSDCC